MATETQHTPGPWVVALMPVTHTHSIFQSGGQTLAYVTPNDGRISLDECDANARLIAAAPELLATLRGIQHRLNRREWVKGEIAAAIEKASAESEGS